MVLHCLKISSKIFVTKEEGAQALSFGRFEYLEVTQMDHKKEQTSVGAMAAEALMVRFIKDAKKSVARFKETRCSNCGYDLAVNPREGPCDDAAHNMIYKEIIEWECRVTELTEALNSLQQKGRIAVGAQGPEKKGPDPLAEHKRSTVPSGCEVCLVTGKEHEWECQGPENSKLIGSLVWYKCKNCPVEKPVPAGAAP